MKKKFMCNTNVEKITLATYNKPKKFLWLTQVTLIYLFQTAERSFNTEVTIYIVSTKSKLNLQQLKHFHMLLRMPETAFLRTKLSKFSGIAYPRTP